MPDKYNPTINGSDEAQRWRRLYIRERIMTTGWATLMFILGLIVGGLGVYCYLTWVG